MSDPTQPAADNPAAPVVLPVAAPVMAPAVEPPAAVQPRVLNPYAGALRPVAAPAVVAPVASPDAPPLPPPDPRIADLMAIVAQDTARDLAAVPAGVRQAVLDLAGDDPIAQRKVLASLRANGVAGTVVLPAGATTAVPTAQPAPAAPSSPDAVALAEYERAKSAGASMLAASLRSRHGAAIDRALAARSNTH